MARPPRKEPEPGTPGHELRQARKRRGLSQAFVAKQVGVNRSTYAHHERNGRSAGEAFSFNPHVLVRAARFLKLPAVHLLELAEIAREDWPSEVTQAEPEPHPAADREDLLARLDQVTPRLNDHRLHLLVEVAEAMDLPPGAPATPPLPTEPITTVPTTVPTTTEPTTTDPTPEPHRDGASGEPDIDPT